MEFSPVKFPPGRRPPVFEFWKRPERPVSCSKKLLTTIYNVFSEPVTSGNCRRSLK
jgi:hypothetical protein